MEDYVIIENIKNVCRICLNESKSMSNMFESNFQYENYSLAELLYGCMFIKIEENELLSDLICSQCETEITQICEFKSKIEKTQEIFQNYLTIIKNEDSNKEKEHVYSNTVFSENNLENNTELYVEDDNEMEIKETKIEIENAEVVLEDSTQEHKVRRYACSKCGTLFSSKVKLRHHKRNLQHYIRESVTCSICSLIIPAQNYKSHIFKHSVNLKCDLCDKKFHNSFNLRRHLQIHTKQTPYSCEMCGLKFTRQEKLKEHLINHASGQLLICTACGQQFENHDGLKEHLEKSKDCVDNFENKYKRTLSCNICSKTFVLSSSLQLHKLLHTDARAICSACGKLYPNENKLKKHWLQVHNKLKSEENSFLCYICAKQFTDKLYFETHIRCHMGVSKRHYCKICNKSFTQSASLQSHNKIHTGEKPFVCHICSKAFNKQCNMQRHIKLHENIRPYTCTLCEKKFSAKHALIIHLRIHTGEKPFECSVCGKDFVDKGSLGRHVKSHTRKT